LRQRTIALLQANGGVGKSVTALNLAAALANKGKRVLLVDLDTFNRSVTNYFEAPPHTLLDVLTGAVPLGLAAAAVRTNLHLLAASPKLSEAGSETLWRRLPGHITTAGFDYCIMDAPAGWHLPSLVAATAADLCLLPVNTAQEALESAVATEYEIRRAVPSVSGVRYLMTMWRDEARLRELGEAIAGADVAWLSARIPHSASIPTIATLSLTCYDDAALRRAGRVRRAFDALGDEIGKVMAKRK
jgi:chromosome partitioning protein